MSAVVCGRCGSFYEPAALAGIDVVGWSRVGEVLHCLRRCLCGRDGPLLPTLSEPHPELGDGVVLRHFVPVTEGTGRPETFARVTARFYVTDDGRRYGRLASSRASLHEWAELHVSPPVIVGDELARLRRWAASLEIGEDPAEGTKS